MDTYKNNGLCQYINKNAKGSDLYFTDLNMSMLIIAKKENQEPLCIVLDDRIDKENVFSSKENQVIRIGMTLANLSELPFYIVRYKQDSVIDFKDRQIKMGYYKKNSGDLKWFDKKITYFVELLNKDNIEAHLQEGSPHKELNDKPSSDFQIWQREHLNVGIFSDIDLIRYNVSKNEIIQIYELKRSTESLRGWLPRYEDYNNYRILNNVCEKLGKRLYIVYNTQIREINKEKGKDKYYYRVEKKDKSIAYDDVSMLHIFKLVKYCKGEEIVPVIVDCISIESFIKNGVIDKISDEIADEPGKLIDDYWNMNKDKQKGNICYCQLENSSTNIFHISYDCNEMIDGQVITTLHRLKAYQKGYMRICEKCRQIK